MLTDRRGGGSHPRKNIFSFSQMPPLGNRSELKLSGIIAMAAMKNVDRENTLYVSYGSGYLLPEFCSNT